MDTRPLSRAGIGQVLKGRAVMTGGGGGGVLWPL